jgi:1,4-alpha-glucan branching enzyme
MAQVPQSEATSQGLEARGAESGPPAKEGGQKVETKREEALGPTTASPADVRRVVAGEHSDPFSILGPHPVTVDSRDRLAIRLFIPGAASMWVLNGGGEVVEATAVHPTGFFEALVEPSERWKNYRARARTPDGHQWEYDDPYRFPGILTDYDLHLLGEGTHLRSFERLGSHLAIVQGVTGVHFAVWAPNAARVSVVGDFNGWDGRRNPARHLGGSGVWELFIPGLRAGDLYKFEVLSRAHGYYLARKADPYAFRSELRPGTASVVHNLDRYEWGDADWMGRRAKQQGLETPISIYEVHLGSWMRGEGDRFLTYRELATRLAQYVTEMGYTHVELLPIQEHPLDASWGYQPLGYFAPTSRFGSPEDFMFFVDHLHRAGIGVILDWVPAHFPRDEHGLRYFDGTHLYEHEDPRQGEHRDWGTMIFNYGRNEVRNFLLGNALFWLEKYHLDGLRVDAVASMLYLDYSRKAGEWIPNRYGGNENLEAISFLKKLNELCHGLHPGVLTFAEESTAWSGVSRPTYLGGLGFSLKWNMGWMNDTLKYFSHEPVHRKYHHNSLTFSLLYAFTENFVLPLSHDEVVHGKRSLLDKMPGDVWQKFANLRALLTFQMCHPGKKLQFMGGEFGMGREWHHDSSIDWHLLQIDWHAGIQRMMRDLNRLYRTQPALHEVDFEWTGFEWVDFHDWEQSIITFIRRAKNPADWLLVACNFTPVPRNSYLVGVGEEGIYQELFNSDSKYYCGGNLGNGQGLKSRPGEVQGRPHSLSITIPPLGVVILKKADR